MLGAVVPITVPVTSSKRIVAGVTLVLGALVVAAVSLAADAGGDGGIVSIKPPGPPVGKAMVPDIAPGPPQDAHISHEQGRWLIRFSTMLVNIGDGDFVLRATRGIRDWEVDQDVQYTESGAKIYRTPARLVWGGDGHNHWHVERIAVGRLAAFAADGSPPTDPRKGRADTKIGFCYYDYIRFLDDAAQNATYPRFGCGEEADRAVGMGLSLRLDGPLRLRSTRSDALTSPICPTGSIDSGSKSTKRVGSTS